MKFPEGERSKIATYNTREGTGWQAVCKSFDAEPKARLGPSEQCSLQGTPGVGRGTWWDAQQQPPPPPPWQLGGHEPCRKVPARLSHASLSAALRDEAVTRPFLCGWKSCQGFSAASQKFPLLFKHRPTQSNGEHSPEAHEGRSKPMGIKRVGCGLLNLSDRTHPAAGEPWPHQRLRSLSYCLQKNQGFIPHLDARKQLPK